MEKGKQVPLKSFTWVAILIIISLVLVLVYFNFIVKPANLVISCDYLLMGLQLLLVILLLIYGGFIGLKWIKYTLDCEIRFEKEREKEINKKQQKEDYEARIVQEHSRDLVNDFFRLIELAKDKPEKSESIPPTEKAEKPFIRIIEKKEGLDLEKLKQLIIYYKEVTTEQKNA
jgi:hypothetical protein